MRRTSFRWLLLAATAQLLACLPGRGQTSPWPGTTEGDYLAKNFKFRSGETLPELRLHYTTLGRPARNAEGRVTNAVLILHGTGGTGHQFLQPIFAGELFGPGQLLDAARYFIILPDGIGHGKSSKPSDEMHAHFPQYDYDDMVLGHYRLLTEGLGVNHLRLILGTSMGCMHSFVWGETYPDFMDALMPLACQPVQLAGRNRIWRKMVMDAIRSDPEWKGGDYTEEPQQGLRTALDLLLIAGSAPLYMQKNLSTRDAADKYLDDYFKTRLAALDANDLLYAVNASRNYDPSLQLEKIIAPMLYINSADDFINPPELGIADREIKRIKNGKFVLLPISDETRGHGTHTRAALWKQYLAGLLVPGPRLSDPVVIRTQPMRPAPSESLESESGVLRAGINDVGFPICLYCPPPEYSDEALRAKYGGRVVLEVTVTTDGNVIDPHVIKGPGLGLEEKALAQVRNWIMRPVLGPSGGPVSCRMQIEVTCDPKTASCAFVLHSPR